MLPVCRLTKKPPFALADIELCVAAKVTWSIVRSHSSTWPLQPTSDIAAWAASGARSARAYAIPPNSSVTQNAASPSVGADGGTAHPRLEVLGRRFRPAHRPDDVEQADGAGEEGGDGERAHDDRRARLRPAEGEVAGGDQREACQRPPAGPGPGGGEAVDEHGRGGRGSGPCRRGRPRGRSRGRP